MGQKVKPIGLRLGINRTWDSRWYAKKNYGHLLIDDLKIRSFIKASIPQAGISKVVIERLAKKIVITIHAARPGVVIAKKGTGLEKLNGDLAKMIDGEVNLNVVEVRKPDLDAQLVAENIGQQISKRASHKRAMKKAIENTMRLGAGGIRVAVSGRLGGADIARTEQYREGRVPLHTLRADVDYGSFDAKTTYGVCGVKVWIFKGEILERDPLATEKRAGYKPPVAGH